MKYKIAGRVFDEEKFAIEFAQMRANALTMTQTITASRDGFIYGPFKVVEPDFEKEFNRREKKEARERAKAAKARQLDFYASMKGGR